MAADAARSMASVRGAGGELASATVRLVGDVCSMEGANRAHNVGPRCEVQSVGLRGARLAIEDYIATVGPTGYGQVVLCGASRMLA